MGQKKIPPLNGIGIIRILNFFIKNPILHTPWWEMRACPMQGSCPCTSWDPDSDTQIPGTASAHCGPHLTVWKT